MTCEQLPSHALEDSVSVVSESLLELTSIIFTLVTDIHVSCQNRHQKFLSWRACAASTCTVSALIFQGRRGGPEPFTFDSHVPVNKGYKRYVPLIVIVPSCILELVPYS